MNFQISSLFIVLTLVLLTMHPWFFYAAQAQSNPEKIDIIIDTDANNEIDDQHALAYLLFSGDHFNVKGVTVNATSSLSGFDTPSTIEEHYNEAKRVMQLSGEFYGKIPLISGAEGSFEDIREHVFDEQFDGFEAVDFIIAEARKEREKELVLLPVGKLTNIALALKKEPAISTKIRVVWLGSNYPDTGEHNKVWDPESMNYILDTDVPFEIVTVRYDEPSGTTAVRVTRDQILHRMPGKGPRISEPVTGRYGGEFDNWGDYSVNLFEMYDMYGNPPGRSLFDMAAVAILKNPEWAESRSIPAPAFNVEEDLWINRQNNPREVILWEWFDIYGIMNDFFQTMDYPVLVDTPSN